MNKYEEQKHQTAHLSLHPSMPSDPNGIIHHDQAEPEADREQRVPNAVAERHRRRQRCAQRRVRRRHPSRVHQHRKVPPFLNKEVQEHLHGLSEDPRDESRDERGVPRQRPEKRADLRFGHRHRSAGVHQHGADAAAAEEVLAEEFGRGGDAAIGERLELFEG